VRGEVTRTLLVGIFLVAVLTVVTVVYIVTRRPKAKVKEEIPMVDVVVANSYLPQGHPITARQIELKKIPMTQVPQDAVRKVEEAVMRIPIQPVAQGEVLRKSILLVSGSIARGYQVPVGNRAIAIYLRAHESTADIVMPGDIVDVFAVYEFTSATGARLTRSSLLAQAVRVLSVDEIVETGEATPVRVTEAQGTQQQQTEQQQSQATSLTRKPQVTMRRVVLSVTPTQAQKILSAIHAVNARIDIAIRNETDTFMIPVVEEQRKVQVSSVAPIKRVAKPQATPKRQIITAVSVPAVPPVRTITVYRGTEKEEVVLPR
jgi:Flp pilus assembly protein CpaB